MHQTSIATHHADCLDSSVAFCRPELEWEGGEKLACYLHPCISPSEHSSALECFLPFDAAKFG
jgi:intergrase/recombinase